MVDAAGINTRIFTLPREVLKEIFFFKKSAEVIVLMGNELSPKWIRAEVSQK